MTADDLYGALDWLGGGQARIEDKLAARHPEDGTLLLYDVASTYFEGRRRIRYERLSFVVCAYLRVRTETPARSTRAVMADAPPVTFDQ